MKRVLCLWLPHWSLQCLGVAHPHLRDQAVALRGHGPRGGEIVADCSAAAWQRGVRVGMPIAEALALGQKTSGSQPRESNQLRQVSSSEKVRVSPSEKVLGSAGVRAHYPDSRSSPLASSFSPHSLHVVDRSAEADFEALSRLAHWCEQFSPLVGWEQPEPGVSQGGGAGRIAGEAALPRVTGDRPGLRGQTAGGSLFGKNRTGRGEEQLFLDVTGTGIFFGGEEVLVRQLLAGLAAQGYTGRVAVADTLGAAYALASCAPAASILEGAEILFQETPRGARPAAWLVAPGRGVEALASLPVTALRLPAETADWLDELGIERIGQLLPLPRTSLGDRFGPPLLRRLDQALGSAPETLLAHRPLPEFRAARTLEFPLERRESVELVAHELLAEVAEALRRRGMGALQLSCRFDSCGYAPVSVQLNLFQPTASSQHLLELIRLQLEQLAFPGPVGRFLLEVGQTGRLREEQTELFPVSDRAFPREVTCLIDRLSSRLGSAGVVQPRLLADAQPERAYRYTPWNQRPPARRRPATSRPLPHALARPLSVCVPAQPLEVLAVVPDGPPRRFREGGRERHIVRHWGPERVETGWWRGRSVRRDYYRVETRSGQRFWLYRQLEDGRWFLQGAFE